MAKKYSKHKKDKSSKNKASSEFSDKEKLKLQILSVQQLSIALNIYGQILSYQSTVLGVEFVQTHFTKNKILIKADSLVKQANYIFFIAALIAFQLSIINYDISYNDIQEGANYSIQPNIDLITANILNLTAEIYYIKAINGLYDRDTLRSIYGLR